MFDLFEPFYKEIQLQHSWNKLTPGTKFTTITGVEIVVINTGIWNIESEPDFKNALIIINNQTLKGDIEIHNSLSDWKNHKHDIDLNYKNVILHVIANQPPNTQKIHPSIPTIVLTEDNLYTKPLRKKYNNGECAQYFKNLTNKKKIDLFQTLGFTRLEKKARLFLKDIISIGAENTLLKGIFDSLGYKKNRKQFNQLFNRLIEYDFNSFTEKEINAVVWGESGLLPDMTLANVNADAIDKIKKIWDIWWKLRKQTQNKPIEWDFSNVRPYNSPYRRIAAASLILQKNKNTPLIETLINIIKTNADNKTIIINLLKYLKCYEPFWNFHLNYSKRVSRPASIIGQARALDIIINIILPFLDGYSYLIKDKNLRTKVKTIQAALPGPQSNIIYKIAFERWGIKQEGMKDILKSPLALQGCIHIFKNICELSCMNCQKCPLLILLKNKCQSL